MDLAQSNAFFNQMARVLEPLREGHYSDIDYYGGTQIVDQQERSWSISATKGLVVHRRPQRTILASRPRGFFGLNLWDRRPEHYGAVVRRPTVTR
jgi:hypothetical protein